MERKNPFVPLDPRSLPPDGPRPLEVVLIRGEAVESRHRVHAVVSDARGEMLRHWGDPDLKFFPRSAIKPIQALTWTLGNAPDKFGLGVEERAIACGSHEGEPVHTELVARWLKKLNLKKEALDCGAHDPTYRPAAKALFAGGGVATELHNNCSGKHCGFLAACLAEGWPTEGYTSFDHPLQERVRELLVRFTDENPRNLAWGIDGCGIPSYHLSLRKLGLAMARLADSEVLGSQIHKAVRELNASIQARPELLGGTGSFSSKVVTETEGRVFAKVGAEGVYGLWIPAERIGLAFKCEDGSARGAEAAVAAVLRELGNPLAFPSDLQRRWAGEVVGQVFCG